MTVFCWEQSAGTKASVEIARDRRSEQIHVFEWRCRFWRCEADADVMLVRGHARKSVAPIKPINTVCPSGCGPKSRDPFQREGLLGEMQ